MSDVEKIKDEFIRRILRDSFECDKTFIHIQWYKHQINLLENNRTSIEPAVKISLDTILENIHTVGLSLDDIARLEELADQIAGGE